MDAPGIQQLNPGTDFLIQVGIPLMRQVADLGTDDDTQITCTIELHLIKYQDSSIHRPITSSTCLSTLRMAINEV